MTEEDFETTEGETEDLYTLLEDHLQEQHNRNMFCVFSSYCYLSLQELEGVSEENTVIHSKVQNLISDRLKTFCRSQGSDIAGAHIGLCLVWEMLGRCVPR